MSGGENVLSDELKEVSAKLDGVKDRLIVIETKMDAFKDMQTKLENTSKTADEALVSTKSAHKRLDKMDENKTWMWRTIGAAVLVEIVRTYLAWKGMK